MARNPKQDSLAQAYRYCSEEEIETHPDANQPRASTSEAEWTAAGELINLNHLIEDVGSILPASVMENLIYDLAADLPLIAGDYRLIRRFFLNHLSDVRAMISLRTRCAQAQRVYLTDILPGANLPEGPYVLIQITEMDCDTDVASKPGFASIWQFLFPCAATPTTQNESAETVEPRVFAARSSPR